MAPKLCLLVCDRYRMETEAVAASAGWEEVIVSHYPSRCGRPPLNEKDLAPWLDEDDGCPIVQIVGGCCVTALARMAPAPVDVQQLEQCFYLLAPQDMVDALLAQGAYLVTPGWLAEWRQHVDEMGFDSKQAFQAFFQESASRIVLLDTGVDQGSLSKLDAFAQFVGLPSSRRCVGLDVLRLSLHNLVLQHRVETLSEAVAAKETLTQRRAADYATTLDLVRDLTDARTELEAIAKILALFTMLFAPGQVSFVRPKAGSACEFYPSTSHEIDPGQVQALLDKLDREDDGRYAWTDEGAGFLLRVTHRRQLLGVLHLREVAFPRYREHYLNLALDIVDVCGLAIHNARMYQQAKEAENSLKAHSQRLEEMAEARAQQLVEAQEQLMRRERLAMLGQMVGSVSHELRNPLGVIAGAAYILRMVLGDDAHKEVRETVDIIDAEVQHAQKIIHDLLDSLRVGPSEPCPVQVSDLVSAALSAAPAPKSIEVSTQFPPDLPLIFCDPQQIVQVLTNLITNAYQAMPDGGQLVVRARSTDDAVAIAVSDTGCGISDDVARHLFEPLFTTKQDGTGLGLTICKNLIEANDGRIEAASDGVNGQGSTFTIALPTAASHEP